MFSMVCFTWHQTVSWCSEERLCKPSSSALLTARPKARHRPLSHMVRWAGTLYRWGWATLPKYLKAEKRLTAPARELDNKWVATASRSLRCLEGHTRRSSSWDLRKSRKCRDRCPTSQLSLMPALTCELHRGQGSRCNRHVAPETSTGPWSSDVLNNDLYVKSIVQLPFQGKTH